MHETPSAPGHEHQNTHHAAGPAPEHVPSPPPVYPPTPQTVMAEQTAAPGADYPSDPIKTLKDALKTFWHNGQNAFWGIVLIQVLLTLATAFVALIALGAILVYILS